MIWLKAHNTLYKDITINHGILDDLPIEYMLPVHIEHVLPDTARDTLTSRYDGLLQPPLSNNDSDSGNNNNTLVLVGHCIHMAVTSLNALLNFNIWHI